MAAQQPQTKLQQWWLLCADEINSVDAWESVAKQEGKQLHPAMVERRKLFRELMAFLDQVEVHRPAVERILRCMPIENI